MVNWDSVPTLKLFFFQINEINYFSNISKFNEKKLLYFLALTLLVLLKLFNAETVIARHKCPKVPAPPGVLGIISSTTLIPSGSTMAAARSSETSGCDRGHPSKNFYKPKKRRLALFLDDNLNNVSNESSRGKGSYLEALAVLAGCQMNKKEFGMILQKNYVKVFVAFETELNHELKKTRSDLISERLLDLMRNSPLLASRCNSG